MKCIEYARGVRNICAGVYMHRKLQWYMCTEFQQRKYIGTPSMDLWHHSPDSSSAYCYASLVRLQQGTCADTVPRETCHSTVL